MIIQEGISPLLSSGCSLVIGSYSRILTGRQKVGRNRHFDSRFAGRPLQKAHCYDGCFGSARAALKRGYEGARGGTSEQIQAENSQERSVSNGLHATYSKRSQAHLVFQSRHRGLGSSSPPVAIPKGIFLFGAPARSLLDPLGRVLYARSGASTFRRLGRAQRLLWTQTAHRRIEACFKTRPT